MKAWCCVAVGLAFVNTGCGSGTDAKPVTPPTVPEPLTAPPPEPPPPPERVWMSDNGVDFVVWTWDAVEDATGYEADVSLRGTPSEGRTRVYPEKPAFRWEGVPPGVEVQIWVRAVRTTAGGTAFSPWAGAGLGYTLPAPEPPRRCTDERKRALAYIGGDGGIVAEWDGTPIRMDYLIHGFPSDVLEGGYLLEQLDLVGRLADQIEEQLGYPILEPGELVEEPLLPAVWGESFGDLDQFPRAPHRILGVVFPLDHPAGGCASWAHPRNAIVGWSLCRVSPPFWPDNPRLQNRSVLHELFHVFGFKHTPGRTTRPEGIGITMSFALDIGPQYRSATWNDIDALRCVFPEDK